MLATPDDVMDQVPGEAPIGAFAHDMDPLFDVDTPPIGLHDRFVMPPFSVLDRRQGEWQARRRRWLALGIQSQLGRADGLTFHRPTEVSPLYDRLAQMDNSSIFDPVLCELVYRWFSRPGATILDPFAGGSVRGIVAATLARHYTGIDIRTEQIAANYAQINLGTSTTADPENLALRGPYAPTWLEGDATQLDDTLSPFDDYDLIFTCPPYFDLEAYSADPRDISGWDYPTFLAGHTTAITTACNYLAENRYAAWVIGDVRDPAGVYRGLHHETVQAFKHAGLHVLNECVIVDPVGTAAVRAARPFQANRKITNTHQHLLVFVKGDVRKAANWAVGDT